MLPLFVTSLEEVDEKYRDLYKKDGDGDDAGFVLDVDDKTYKSKLDEFRTNNRALHREREQYRTKLEALAEQYKDIDPEKFNEMQERLGKLDQLEDKDLFEKGGIDAVIEKRTQTMAQAHKKEMEKLQTQLQTSSEAQSKLKSTLASSLIDAKVQNTINQLGVAPAKGALSDILGRARQVWSIDDDGNIVGKDLIADDGKDMTMEQWGKKLVEDASHLFAQGSGGGAGGGGGGGPKGGVKRVAGDPITFGKYADQIADGTVVVDESLPAGAVEG